MSQIGISSVLKTKNQTLTQQEEVNVQAVSQRNQHRYKRISAGVVALLCSVGVQAASPDPVSGDLLQQTVPKPVLPQARSLPLVIPTEGVLPDDVTPLPVKHIVLQGNKILSTETLNSVLEDELDKPGPLSLKRLALLAQLITNYYHEQGYFLSRAYVPAQTLSGDSVTLIILEAEYGQITVTNNSRVNDTRLNSYIEPLKKGEAVKKSSLYRSLLLLEQLPGAKVQAQVAPGANRGETNLLIDAQSTAPYEAQLNLDNAGNQASGRVRLSGQITVNSPWQLGDELTANVLSSGVGLNFLQGGYSAPVNGMGTRVGGELSWLQYNLQGSFSSLDAEGNAAALGLWVEHPLLLTNNALANVRVTGNHKQFEDTMTGTFDRQRELQSLMVTLAASRRLQDWGVVSASLATKFGQLNLQDSVSRNFDAVTARSNGNYLTWNLALAFSQNLPSGDRLYAGFRAQHSGDNLDSSEQFQLGGMGNLPGYELGTISGSSGTLATLALRHDVTYSWLPQGRWEGELFFDAGRVKVNAKPWTTGSNKASLYDAGLGLTWTGANQWQVHTEIAQYIGKVEALAGSKPDLQAWLRISKGF